MKINRIAFSKLKTQWEILKMKSAYIEAEKHIVQDPSVTGWQKLDVPQIDPKMFWEMDQPLADLRDARSTDRAIIKAQIEEIEETGRKLLAEEKYELLEEAKEVWERLQQQLKNLK